MLNVPNSQEMVTQEIVLFLDVDGTLLDFADTPNDVYVSEELIGNICTLRARTNNAIALISGRMLDDIDRLFAPLKLPGAYSHGGEFRYPSCKVIRNVSPNARIAAAIELAESWRKLYPEIVVEHKGDSLALHYRAVPDMANEVVRFAQELRNSLGSDYHLLEGSKVVEIKPGCRNKGDAIRALMVSPQWSCKTPVFIGDDTTDEDGFKAVNEAGGLSIKVGNGKTVATSHLQNPHAVRELLKRLVA